jgi:hypothetical protein
MWCDVTDYVGGTVINKSQRIELQSHKVYFNHLVSKKIRNHKTVDKSPATRR